MIRSHLAFAKSLQGFSACAQLLNEQFERVFYKNDFASGVALLSLYMICEFRIS